MEAIKFLRHCDNLAMRRAPSYDITVVDALKFARKRYATAEHLLQEEFATHPQRFNIEELEFASLSTVLQTPHIDPGAVSKISQHYSIDVVLADVVNNLATCYELLEDWTVARSCYEVSLSLRRVSIIYCALFLNGSGLPYVT
jgi:hypothetical protein